MINYPFEIKQQDEPKTMLYYSDIHCEIIERVLVAIVTTENKGLMLDIHERIIDSTYVFIGEL